ncbi:NACHT, LRR and PYD domains-containing protein 3-like [Puntigrus tetrazona]|uniref:NACHT, LRR and PYD domains-containing protein 3-like n=1 Tax=Puntigrus tetrazona TaxID=1606681 RepID=UPI001C8A4247|nr:NACHT, LRR and PYD domains-containing protein 3-like [Puntigrus tetrazona]
MSADEEDVQREHQRAPYLESSCEMSVTSDPRRRQTAASPASSCVSMKCNESVGHPPDFCNETVTSHPVDERNDLVKSVNHLTTSLVEINIIQQRIKDTHKTCMKNKYETLFEGITQKNQTLLNRIYTELYIIEGESEGVNEEHEIVQIEKNPKTQPSQDTPILCNDIFKPLHHSGCEGKKQIKAVLTKGIAGIGKTVSVQKFILDWAEGKANQDVDFMFVLPFRELNLIEEHQYSLHRLLLDFYPELHDLDSEIYEECKVVFIFDGLDESRIAMNFSDTEKASDVTEISSVSVLITNLIKGDLLPCSHIWITSRPAAAKRIPSQYINRLTEIQGFNESQKEEYFKKRISDEHQASRIISHIKRSRSLYIMCHIPVFCWILATVLQNHLNHNDSAEIPKTLTEMYIHFLLSQINTRNQKYEEKDSEKILKSNREMIVKLAELAFKQLMKGNVMFYEEDLIESGIDVTDASVYSGICTEIFKEESVIHQRKVYSFIHLSFQEFLAAFCVFFSHVVQNTRLLQLFLGHNYERYRSEYKSLCELLKTAVYKTLESENGQLDLFIRFLLGISLESNQRLFEDLLIGTVNSSESITNITQYIKDKIKDGRNLFARKSIILLLCLLEMKDQTLYREIQDFVKSDKHSKNKLSPAHCSAIAYMLQMSEEVLDELDLKKYNTTDEGRRRLLPAVSNCRKGYVSCNLTAECCDIVFSILQSPDSLLRELDLTNNNLQDRENSPQSQLERGACCNHTDDCCKSAPSVLQLTDPLLGKLDLQESGENGPQCQLMKLRLAIFKYLHKSFEDFTFSSQPSNYLQREPYNNDQQYSGMELLFAGLTNPYCKLQILRLAICNLTDQSCKGLASALQSSDSSLRELDLSNNDLHNSGVNILCFGLQRPNCTLEILRLSGCMVTVEGCCYLASALRSNPSHLRELDLSYNHPGDSGVKLLSDLLEDPGCNLDKLNVGHVGELMITAGLHKYACDLTLDPNTANVHLCLSEENRKVTRLEEQQSYPDHPDRFDFFPQVVCRESLTGRCYWEVKWSGWRGAVISVAYKEMSRKGGSDDCRFGFNEKSWSLDCSDDIFTVWHNKLSTDIPVPHSSKRVGVYLDWEDGTLSFYSVSKTHTLTHLHTFYSTFTEPLCAGFRVFTDSSVSLCQMC